MKIVFKEGVPQIQSIHDDGKRTCHKIESDDDKNTVRKKIGKLR